MGHKDGPHHLFKGYGRRGCGVFSTFLTAGWFGFIARVYWLILGSLHFATFLGALTTITFYAYAIISIVEACVLFVAAIAFSVLNWWIPRDLDHIVETELAEKKHAAEEDRAAEKQFNDSKLIDMDKSHYNAAADGSTSFAALFWSIFEMAYAIVLVWGQPGSAVPQYLKHVSVSHTFVGPLFGGSPVVAFNAENTQLYVMVQIFHAIYLIKMFYFWGAWFYARFSAIVLHGKIAHIEMTATPKSEVTEAKMVRVVSGANAVSGRLNDKSTVPLVSSMAYH